MRKIFVAAIVVLLLSSLLWFFLHQSKQKALEERGLSKAIPPDSTDLLWFKNSVIYTLDVETFKDSDDDGIGDFKGLTQKLGYIDSLGADVIWLAPFQPSPNKDDGYDVSDFYGIDSRLGTMADFRAFIQAANQHHIKVIMDLVLNHTSNEHPWFQQARQSETSPYHSWYLWSKERPKNYNVGMVFPGVQKDIWTYDSVAKEYYYHRFYNFQPDLNTQNPSVQSEVRKIVKHWIDLGLSGFRLDAVPFFIEVPKKEGEEFDHRFEMLTQLRSYLQSLKKDAIILGEANVLPDETEPYFGKKGDAMHMMFNFFVNQHLFYALATGDVKPLKEALEETENIPKTAQWGQFLRNHDELDLGRLSKGDRAKVFAAFGPDKSMQLYDRGIRRRLAPMVNNDLKRMELAYSVLFSLPSTPVMRYGDEIGMGDNLALKERESVRTPMQWSSGKNAGFSAASNTVKPVIDTGRFGSSLVNVVTEEQQSASLLHWIEKLIRLHKACPEIAYGGLKLIDVRSPHVLAIRYNWRGKSLVVMHNLSKEKENVNLAAEDGGGLRRTLLFSSDSTALNSQGAFAIEGYGFRWYRME